MGHQSENLSRQSLQDQLLNRLSELANLRKESKQLRSRLADVRSAVFACQQEIKQVQQLLSLNVSVMKPAPPAEEPKWVRKHGRWGKTWFEQVPNEKAPTEELSAEPKVTKIKSA